ncbi:unnamed protein product [Hymenolepis diminuta]|uniref:Uncharacterized protein n=1 Tax=Hymenolepis diminuta TaxID=6216 RepID=A0A564Z1P1_HYMDI|nr:unnamed protein product [Hymenolepis diminuta]
MSKRPHQFLPSFSVTASLHLKSRSALMFSRVLTQVTHMRLSLFATQQRTLVSYRLLRFLLIYSLPHHAPLPLSFSLSLSLSVTRLKLLYIFGLINSWCPASQLLLALTQTARN